MFVCQFLRQGLAVFLPTLQAPEREAYRCAPTTQMMKICVISSFKALQDYTGTPRLLK